MIDCPKTITAPKFKIAPQINASWTKAPWNTIPENKLSYYMGEKPQHIPDVHFKIAYDNEALYIIFNVKDKNTRAVAKGYHGPVWEDSCVEFFFAPSGDITKGYFNVEINCGGTLLLNFQTKPREDIVFLSNEACDQVTISATHPKIVEPEIKEENEWNLEYRLPFSALEGFCKIVKPTEGVVWPANFYKCADMTSTPHWLTWSFVNDPTPNFHVPESFGTIKFD